MRTSAVALISLLAASRAALALATPSDYVIDNDHTEVGFEVSHLVVSKVKGRFGSFEGTFRFDPQDPKSTTLEATAEVASVNTGNAKRDDHLRSPDFFHAKAHPRILFKSKKVTGVAKGKRTFKLVGDLTIKGVTKEVAFDVEFRGTAKAYDKRRAAFSASTTIDRKDFKVSFDDVVESGPVVGDKVTIVIEAQGIDKADL